MTWVGMYNAYMKEKCIETYGQKVSMEEAAWVL